MVKIAGKLMRAFAAVEDRTKRHEWGIFTAITGNTATIIIALQVTVVAQLISEDTCCQLFYHSEASVFKLHCSAKHQQNLAAPTACEHFKMHPVSSVRKNRFPMYMYPITEGFQFANCLRLAKHGILRLYRIEEG